MLAFVDALGREVEVRRQPRRIVSLVPSWTEALFAFGLGEAVVGVTRFCVEPREGVAGKAKVGGTKTLDVERVRELAPDLVLANAEENERGQIEELIGTGLTVFVTFPRTVAGAIETMGQLAAMTGSLGAWPLVEAAEVALAEARAANVGRRPLRVFCPIWRNPRRQAQGRLWMTIGPDTYMHDFIAACGGANVFGDSGERYPRLELAAAASRDPEVVLLPDEPYRFRERHVPELRAFAEVSAVRQGRIYLLEGKHLCWYGPRIAGSLRYVRGLLWGQGG
ncbi:MAG TPA: helical backbone metal receptor [Dehalococcoidia bacterium]|nr:helical backbone metal receptor [Dehalococcoidia bacterium]